MVLHYIASWALLLAHPTPRKAVQTSYRVTRVEYRNGTYICSERTLAR